MDDISQYGSKEVKLILVGNKSDLYTERVVPFKEAEEFASKNNLKYIEVSAKTGNNIVLLFERITEMMIRSEVENEIKGKGKDKTANHVIMNKSLTIQNKTDVEIIRKKSKGCCS